MSAERPALLQHVAAVAGEDAAAALAAVLTPKQCQTLVERLKGGRSQDWSARESWPPMLRRIAELIGDEACMRLAAECGGQDRVYVPKNVWVREHPWATLLTSEQWALVVDRYGGRRLSENEATVALLRELLGGVAEQLPFGAHGSMRVPVRCNRPQHPWERVLTRDEFQKLTEEFGGQRVDLPRGTMLSRKLAIYDLADMKLTRREIARRVGVGERYVRKVLEASK